jgi:hypothetical protein
VNVAPRDTLLRIAEPPRLYLPCWFEDMMVEATRTPESKPGVTKEQTAHLVCELRKHFEDAWVDGFELFIPDMANHPKDRQVLAAAVRCGVQAIVTLNLKDFPEDALSPWDVMHGQAAKRRTAAQVAAAAKLTDEDVVRKVRKAR